MRKIIPLNKDWAFTRQADVPPTQMPQTWPLVDLPHTWNALDGQDGGNDYDRGTGYYAKTFPGRLPLLPGVTGGQCHGDRLSEWPVPGLPSRRLQHLARRADASPGGGESPGYRRRQQ